LQKEIFTHSLLFVFPQNFAFFSYRNFEIFLENCVVSNVSSSKFAFWGGWGEGEGEYEVSTGCLPRSFLFFIFKNPNNNSSKNNSNNYSNIVYLISLFILLGF